MSGAEGHWDLHSDDGLVRTWVQDTHVGDTILRRVRKEFYGAEAFLAQCAEDRAALAGKRWNEGQIIGRMPHALRYSSGYAEAHRQGDKKWIANFWNDGDNSRLRVKEGRV